MDVIVYACCILLCMACSYSTDKLIWMCILVIMYHCAMCDMFFLRSRGQYFHFVVLWSSTPYNLELTVLTKCLKICNEIHETTKTRHQHRTLRVFTRDFDYFLASSESSRVTLARLEASSKFRTHTRHACWG